MYFIPSSGATRHLPPKGKVLKLPDKLKFDALVAVTNRASPMA